MPYSFSATVFSGGNWPKIKDAKCTLQSDRLVATDGSKVHQMAFRDIREVKAKRRFVSRKLVSIWLYRAGPGTDTQLWLHGSAEDREDVWEHVRRAVAG